MEIKPGMIGFSGGNGFTQRAIRLFIGSDFSHSFTVMKGPGEYLSALETTSTIVCLTPFSNKDYEENWVEMWDVNADIELKQSILEMIYGIYSGTWYAYLAMIWFMFRYEYRRCGYEPRKMWKWCTSGIGCTELTSTYVKYLFPELITNDLNTYSPKELRDIMLRNPGKFTCLGWYKAKK
jgi:hypothetical protein